MANKRKKIKPEVWIAVINRDGPYCRYCGHPCGMFGWAEDRKFRIRPMFWGFNLDHVVPHSAGGPDTVENLVVSCPTCNRKKWTGAAPPMRPRVPFVLGPPRGGLFLSLADRPYADGSGQDRGHRLWERAVRLAEAT